MAAYSLTLINVQGNVQEVFELYADESKEQTVAFVCDENQVNVIGAAPDLLRACQAALAYLADPASPYYINRKKAAEMIHKAVAKAEGY